MKKTYLPGIFFLAFLYVFALLLVLLPARDYSEREKRFLTTSPQIDADTIRSASLAQTLEEWAADQFPLRDLFVGLSAYADLAAGKNTAQGVVMGKDGWLFAAPSQDTGKVPANLSAIEAFRDSTGLELVLTAIPESGYIYKEKLPALAAPYPDAAVLETLRERFPEYLDVSAALADAHEENMLYYKTDHHLTSEGSYLVYASLCPALGLAPNARGMYAPETHEGFYGTAFSSSGYWLTKPDDIELWRWDGDEAVTVSIPENDTEHAGFFFTEYLSQEDKYPVYLGGNHSLTHLHNDAAPEGALVVVKDSFAHCLAGFLSSHYRDIYLVDLRYYKEPVSALAADVGAQQVLVLYGVSDLLSDSSLVWLR
ncbi:MAG: hypothetical protein II727_09350 [Oscillospiraceae bacterium]|nr:hypothetical protein [Oscillospiraceae bacterium]